ncbi:MAG TPA: zinc ribbon domain-containing protein [Blastocatellia bacterium]
MYCQTCGTELIEGLRYCKRCGTSLKISDQPSYVPGRSSKLSGMVIFILAIMTFACLTGLLIFASAEAHDLRSEAIVFIVIAGLAMIFGVDAMMLKFIIEFHGPEKRAAVQADARPEIAAPRTAIPAAAQLDTGPTAVPSVTEHTTRSFDPRREGLTR